MTRIATVGLVLGLAVLTGIGGGPAAAGTPRIVDAHGRQLGTLIGLNDGLAEIVLSTSGPTVSLVLGRDGVVSDPLTAALFSSDDCSGTPRLLDLTPLLPPALQLIGVQAGVTPDGRVVVPSGAAPVMTPVESLFSQGRLLPCDSTVTGVVGTVPVDTVLDIAAFSPPFEVVGHQAEGSGDARRLRQIGVVTDGAGQPLGPLTGGDVGMGARPPLVAAALFETAAGPAPVVLAGNTPLLGTALVVYEALDCTGTPYLLDLTGVGGGDPLFPLIGVAADGKLLEPGALAGPVTVHSGHFPLLTPTGCLVTMFPAGGIRLGSLVEDLALRPAPFALGLREASVGSSLGRASGGDHVVVDADGTLLGTIVGVDAIFSGTPRVLVRAGRRLGEASVEGHRVAGGTRAARYASAACAGAPLVEAGDPADPAPLYPHTALGPGAVLYSADGPLDVADLQFMWSPDTGSCDPDPLGPSFVRHTSPLRDFSGATPPFAIR